MLRRKKTPPQTPETRKKYEFHVPPGIGIGTANRILAELRVQGLLQGEPEDWTTIPLASSRHLYHQDKGKK